MKDVLHFMPSLMWYRVLHWRNAWNRTELIWDHSLLPRAYPISWKGNHTFRSSLSYYELSIDLFFY